MEQDTVQTQETGLHHTRVADQPTEADLLAALVESLNDGRRVYSGPGAYTITDMLEHPKNELKSDMLRELVDKRVESGALVQVTVERVARDGRRYKAPGYVDKDVYERFRASQP